MNKEEEPPEQYLKVFNKGLEFVVINFPKDDLNDVVLFGEAVSLFTQGRRIKIDDLNRRPDYYRLNSLVYGLFINGMRACGYTTNNGEVKNIQGRFQGVFDMYYALKHGILIGEE